jgi:AraC family transcriptional regulator
MGVIGRGRIVVWEGASLWVFAGTSEHAETNAHAHHALQITFALEGGFELHAGDEVATGPCAVVAPDVPHVYVAHGVAAHIFVEPDSALGQSLSRRWFVGSSICELPTNDELSEQMALLTAAFRNAETEQRLIDLGQGLLRELTQGAGLSLPEPRVAAMIQFITNHLDQQITLSMVSRHTALSPSRASHLFVQHTGLPLKTYILWRRVAHAVKIYGQGSNLTEAAYAAGFADSAHLSRTFRRMFGLPAAALQITHSE